MTRTDPLSEKPMEGVVLDKSKSRLQVVVKDYPPNVSEGTWVLTTHPLITATCLGANPEGSSSLAVVVDTASGQGRQQGVARPHD